MITIQIVPLRVYNIDTKQHSRKYFFHS